VRKISVILIILFVISSIALGQSIIGPDPSRTVLLVTPGFVPEGTSEKRIVAEIWPAAIKDGAPMWQEGPYDSSWFSIDQTVLPADRLSVEKIVGRMKRPTGEPADVKVLVTKVSTLNWPSDDLELTLAPKIRNRFMVRIRLIRDYGDLDVGDYGIIAERYLNEFYINASGVARFRVKDAFGEIPDDGHRLEILFPAEYPISLTVSNISKR